jgi:hypothetical protein
MIRADNRDPVHRVFTIRAGRVDRRRNRFHADSLAMRIPYALFTIAHFNPGNFEDLKGARQSGWASRGPAKVL